MASAANQDAYGNPAWGNPRTGNSNPAAGNAGPWGPNPGWGNSPQWGGPPFWHPAWMSRPVGIAFMVLGFIFWWPVGLAMLFYMIGSGRMGCFGRRRRAMYQAQNWQNQGGNQDASPWGNWKSWASNAGTSRPASSSGNHAFDEYKAETLRRLEEEQQEFGSFLERLRFAKDKAEFDQFMAERRNRPPAPPSEDHPAA